MIEFTNEADDPTLDDWDEDVDADLDEDEDDIWDVEDDEDDEWDDNMIVTDDEEAW